MFAVAAPAAAFDAIFIPAPVLCLANVPDDRSLVWSGMDSDAKQPRLRIPHHHRLRPAAVPVILLFVTPPHLERRAGRLLPPERVVDISFPPWRPAAEDFVFERSRPTERAMGFSEQ